MPPVAEQLRRAREEQGLSLRDLAELTKIRSDHLEALEHARYDPFPAPVYIRGSVRTCAAVLKLDVPAVLAELDAELAESPEFSEPPSLTGQRRGPLDWLMYHLSRVNWRLTGMVILAMVAVAVTLWAWSAWHTWIREDPLKALGPGLYQPRDGGISEGDLLPVPQEQFGR
jgi:cytoskeletal protein RodZ